MSMTAPIALDDGALCVCHFFLVPYTAAAPPTISESSFGNAGLAVLVVDQRQLVDQGGGVVRSRFHRHHGGPTARKPCFSDTAW